MSTFDDLIKKNEYEMQQEGKRVPPISNESERTKRYAARDRRESRVSSRARSLPGGLPGSLAFIVLIALGVFVLLLVLIDSNRVDADAKKVERDLSACIAQQKDSKKIECRAIPGLHQTRKQTLAKNIIFGIKFLLICALALVWIYRPKNVSFKFLVTTIVLLALFLPLTLSTLY